MILIPLFIELVEQLELANQESALQFFKKLKPIYLKKLKKLLN